MINTNVFKAKKMSLVLLAALTVFLLSAPTAHAIPIGTVGGLDELILGEDLSNSGNQTELEWMAAELLALGYITAGEEVDYWKLSGSGGEDGVWEQVDEDPDLWAIDFTDFGVTAPVAFLVKVGDGKDSNGVMAHNLYLNNYVGGTDPARYGVISLDELSTEFRTLNIQAISHVAKVGGAPTTVPEPSSLLLLMLGLGILPFACRRS